MLLNCENTSEEYERICPCLPLPLAESALQAAAEESAGGKLYSLLPSSQDLSDHHIKSEVDANVSSVSRFVAGNQL